MAENLLQVNHLSTHFFTRKGIVKAVNDVSFSVDKGEIVGLVGESGAGKSITGFSLLRLIDEPGRIVSGEVLFKGDNLLEYSEKRMQQVRGKEIAMVFQDPQTSLDPVFTIGYQIIEVIRIHQKLSHEAARKRAVKLLAAVGIPSPEERLNNYPHQFSGGMRQRVVIAMAIATNPSLIIADEPTTALDVTTQAQVLSLMRNLVKNYATAMILITHDIALVGQFCNKICVMYAGNLIEYGPTRKIIREPRHPYTQGLLSAIPRLQKRKGRLKQIRGIMPNLTDLPAGCTFKPRCDQHRDCCGQPLQMWKVGDDHYSACI